MSLSIRNLTVHYGKLEAVSQVSLDVLAGAMVALLGANGSGKSTVLRAITGLVAPTSGQIWFDGKQIDSASTTEIAKLGISMAPEGRKLFPYMTVLENLLMGAYLRKRKDEISSSLRDVFEHFPVLGQRKHVAASKLSGGEQEMVAIARALMSRPKLLLMDEPAQGLAPGVVAELARIIKELHQRGIGIVLVEHNIPLVLSLVEKVYVLETGSVVFEGSPSELSEDEFVRRIYLAASQRGT